MTHPTGLNGSLFEQGCLTTSGCEYSYTTTYGIVKNLVTLVIVARNGLLFSRRFFYDVLDMATRTNNPSWKSAAEVLGALLPHLPIAGRVQEYRVWEVWEEAVGEAVARKARPRKIRNGRLVVIASNSAYLQELQFYKAQIKDAVNQRLGAAVVKDIFFALGRVRDTASRPAAPPHRPLPPFSELTVPALGRPDLETAFAALLAARRRRLSKEEPHG